MDLQEPDSFDSSKFKQDLLAKIIEITPKNQKEVDEFKENDSAGSIKSAVKSGVAQGKETAQGPIKQTTEQPPDTSLAKPKEVTPAATDRCRS